MSEAPMGIIGEIKQRTNTIVENAQQGFPEVKDLIAQGRGREALETIAGWFNKQEKSVQEPTLIEKKPPKDKEAETSKTVPKTRETEPFPELALPSIEDFPKKMQPELKKGLERLREDCTKLKEKIAHYGDELPETVKKENIITMHNIIEENVCPFELGNSTSEHTPLDVRYFYSREYIKEILAVNEELKKFCQEDTEFFKTIEIPTHWVGNNPIKPVLNFDEIINAAKMVSQENQEFGSSRKLLSHTTGDTESTFKVLQRGVLASKQYQLDNFGEYFFNTVNYPTPFGDVGGVRVTNEGKFYTKNYSNERYVLERPRVNSGKHPYAEFFDIDFSGGEELWGFEGRGVNFIFSRRNLFSQNENGPAAAEGIAIYDHVRGAFVDLTKEPFLVVVDERKKEKVLTFIKEGMVTSPNWQGKIPDVEEWITKHVFVKPENLLQGEELRKKLENKLFTSFLIPDKEGCWIPVDFNGEHRIYHSLGEKYPYEDQLEHPFSGIDKERLQKALEDGSFDPNRPRQVHLKILAELKKDAYWASQINKPSGLLENYSLQEHTLMVAAQFEKYFADKPLPGGVDRSLFRLIIENHDIGKGDAVLANKSSSQHEYTLPIVTELLERLGYNENEIALAKGLLSGDPLGNYLKGNTRCQDSAKEVENMREIAKVDPEQFFDLLTILYQIDAGSYTEDAGGFKSLDSLFVFDPKNRRMAFSLETQIKINELKRLIT